MRSSFFLFVALFAVIASTEAGAATLTKGPYLQDLRQDGLVVVWETDTASEGTLEYGLTDGFGTDSASGSTGTHHEVRLTGLDAATEYFYRVKVDGQPAGQMGSFVTAPSDKVPFTFLAYGDTRSDPAAHALITATMMQHQAAFIIHTGDMVASGEVEADWDGLFTVEADQFRNTVFWPVIGNHEEHDGEAPPPFIRLLVPPESAEAHPTYYSFDYSNSHFIVLDGHVAVESGVECTFRIMAFEECFSQAQMTWLEADLAAANADPGIEHVFVIVHVGPYSSKSGRSGSAQMRALFPLFAESKVAMVISGHDHYYEHGMSSNRMHYVITGGGGAPLYETKGPEGHVVYPHEILVSTSVYNFQSIFVDGQKIEVVSYEADGSVLESFEVEPRAVCTLPADCETEQEGVCEGEWICNGNQRCQWLCVVAKPCFTEAECGDPPGDRCPGNWECLNSTCAWVCDAEPDCVEDDDCLGRDGLTDCEKGFYSCLNGMCEWTCPPIREDDTGAMPDQGIAPDAGTGTGGGNCSQGGSTPVGGLFLTLSLMLGILWTRRRHATVDGGL